MSPAEPLALVLEQCSLFAIWNHTRRRETIGWLIGGCTLLAGAAALVGWLPPSERTGAYLAFAGSYLVAGLAWSTLMEGLHPRDWMLGEAFVGVLAAAMFMLAAVDPAKASSVDDHRHRCAVARTQSAVNVESMIRSRGLGAATITAVGASRWRSDRAIDPISAIQARIVGFQLWSFVHSLGIREGV